MLVRLMAGKLKTFLSSVALDGLTYYRGAFACCFHLSVKGVSALCISSCALLQQWYFHLTS